MKHGMEVDQAIIPLCLIGCTNKQSKSDAGSSDLSPIVWWYAVIKFYAMLNIGTCTIYIILFCSSQFNPLIVASKAHPQSQALGRPRWANLGINYACTLNYNTRNDG